jgi:AP-3 complex subunit mu
VDPLFAFAFLQTFIEILREYFGTVSAATLKDNFDVVYQASPSMSLSVYCNLNTP